MAYTVKQLAKISGVSIRTLHFYDEIGLLKPAFYGVNNNYRYYEQEQLLMLQQIMFYKELGLSLDEIKNIISSSDFNKIESLSSHRNILLDNITKFKKLINNIDKTICYLKGEINMLDNEMFDGFDAQLQKLQEDYLVNQGVTTKATIDQSWTNVKHWKKTDWEKYKNDWAKLNQEFTSAHQQKLAPECVAVQDLVRQHYALVKISWTPDRQSYIGLGELYCNADGEYKYYEEDLAQYIVKAMEVFSNNEL